MSIQDYIREAEKQGWQCKQRTRDPSEWDITKAGLAPLVATTVSGFVCLFDSQGNLFQSFRPYEPQTTLSL